MTVAAGPAMLAAKEYGTLAELSTNAGRVLTREHLLRRVWGLDADVRPMRTTIKQHSPQAWRRRRKPRLHHHRGPRRLPDAEGGEAGAVRGMTITVTNGGRRMPCPDLAVVTGAFSYTGRYVTCRLLGQGVRVGTLTRSTDAEDPFGGQVEVPPWTSPIHVLCRSMQGAGVFYNTY